MGSRPDDGEKCISQLNGGISTTTKRTEWGKQTPVEREKKKLLAKKRPTRVLMVAFVEIGGLAFFAPSGKIAGQLLHFPVKHCKF